MSLNFTRPKYWTLYNSYYNTTTTTDSQTSEIMTDYRTPLKRTPSGKWRKPTSYSRMVETGSVKSYQIKGSDQWNIYNGNYQKRSSISTAGAFGAGGYYYVEPPSLPAGVENDLVIKVRSKIKGMRVNYSQAFGERKQTARLVGDTLVRLANIVRDVKAVPRHLNKRYFKYLKNKWHNEDFFNYWLELQYGWKPLLSDVYGSVANLHEREKDADRGRVSVKAGYRDNTDSLSKLSDSANTLVWDFYRRSKVEHKAYIRLDFRQQDGAPQGNLAQLGITNPLELAWELLPWSFVADWFVPIGDYLSSLDATLGWDFLGGSLSSKSTRHVFPVNAKVRSDPYKYQRSAYVGVSGSGRQMRFDRKAYDECPTPARPSLEKLNKSSHMHVANGIALLMSLITGGTRVR